MTSNNWNNQSCSVKTPVWLCVSVTVFCWRLLQFYLLFLCQSFQVIFYIPIVVNGAVDSDRSGQISYRAHDTSTSGNRMHHVDIPKVTNAHPRFNPLSAQIKDGNNRVTVKPNPKTSTFHMPPPMKQQKDFENEATPPKKSLLVHNFYEDSKHLEHVENLYTQTSVSINNNLIAVNAHRSSSRPVKHSQQQLKSLRGTNTHNENDNEHNQLDMPKPASTGPQTFAAHNFSTDINHVERVRRSDPYLRTANKHLQQQFKPEEITDIHARIRIDLGLMSIEQQPSTLKSNHSNHFAHDIIVDYPPNLIFRTTGKSYESTTFMWDAFAAHDHIYFIFSRYLEYSKDFHILRDLTISIPAIEVNDSCSLALFDLERGKSFQKTNPNQISICKIVSSKLLDYWGKKSDEIEVQIDVVGLRKIFNLTRLESASSPLRVHIPPALRNLYFPTVNSLNASNSNYTDHFDKLKLSPSHPTNLIVGVTMIGTDVDVSSIVTWMQYHLHLNVPYFQLYFMVALDSLSREYVDVLNVFHARCGGCFSVMQWYTFYVPGLVSLQKEPACSHLALINSVLHRLALYKRSLGARHSEYKSLRMWLMQIDVDDFLVPPEKKVGLHEHFTMLPSGVASVTFDNAYFYMLPPDIYDSNKELIYSLDERAVLELHRLKSNFTFSDMIHNVIIRENNIRLHMRRPKLVHNVDLVYLAGAHQANRYLKNALIYRDLEKYIYLHHIKTARGRTIDIIEKPIPTKFLDFSDPPKNISMFTC